MLPINKESEKMNLYKKQLIKEGFSETNADRITNAIDVLHSAIVKMDQKQLQLLVDGVSIAVRLEEFAKIEELCSVRID